MSCCIQYQTDFNSPQSTSGLQPIKKKMKAEQSFQQFIYSKPESTYITELKPNSSTLEMMLFKEKIASAIMSMQEMEKAKSVRSMEPTGGDCFIETTKVSIVDPPAHDYKSFHLRKQSLTQIFIFSC